MKSDSDHRATKAAELLLHLGRLTHGGVVRGEGLSCGLTSAQWTALGYFARANRFSRTLSAFADFHATTRGTASQTVKSLVTKGYLERTPSQLDGRSHEIDLTARGQELIKKDPFGKLVNVIAELPETQQAKMAELLEHLMGRITADRSSQIFGTCPSCRFLEEYDDRKGNKVIQVCRRLGEALEPSQFGELCVHYEPVSQEI